MTRGKGSGSVFQRAKDGRWLAQVDSGYTPAGKRRRITRVAATRKGAEVKLKQMLAELDAVGTVGSRVTVKSWSDAWLEITEATLRPASWRANRSAVANHIVPVIGRRRLGELTPADVRAVVDGVTAKGLGDATAKRTHSTLSGLLRAALLEGHHVPARVFEVKPPAATPSDREDIPIADALRILEVAADLPHGSRWAAALLNGIRQGEALGLTWDRVDLLGGQLLLDWQLQPLVYKDRAAGTFRVPRGYEARQLDGRFHLVRVKSKAGHRVIPLVPWLADALREWKRIAPESPHGLVWPRLDGRPATAKDDLAEWHAIQSTAGVGHQSGRFYGTHEARHTTATLLLELGVDPTIITAILGHSSIVVSRGYMHASQEASRRALSGVAERLGLTVRSEAR